MSREIDALIAERVMEYPVKHRKTPVSDYWVCILHTWIKLPPYSTDIAAAWEVVEKINLLGERGWLRKESGGGWEYYEYEYDFEPVITADTAPMAICLAALKLKGVDRG